MVARSIALIALLVAADASAQQLEDNVEVSYLVFHRAAGFDRPAFETDVLDGSLTIAFKTLPAGWRNLLAPQIASDKKQKFFKAIEVDKARPNALRVELGIGAFTTEVYAKHRPQRWVLRIGEARTPPFGPGPWAVPVVPYADLVDEETPGRATLAAAELALAEGASGAACPTFVKLMAARSELQSWAALRHADCLMARGSLEQAAAVLTSVTEAGKTPAAIHLARLRLEELSGRVLRGPFKSELYRLDKDAQIFVGTVADETAVREARARLFRAEAVEALEALQGLYKQRTRSPFFQDPRMLQALRWRSVRDTTRRKEWTLAARAYLQIDAAGIEHSPENVPHWLDMHVLGARALREIGLPLRAIKVYQYLLASKAEIDEPVIMCSLAEAYHEADDDYRARITLDFVSEKYPSWRKSAAALKLQAALALRSGEARASATPARDLARSGHAATDPEAAQLVTAHAVAALETEGVPAAREALDGAAGPLADTVRTDLAMAAGDCDALVKAAAPLELASAASLLFAGSCLLREGRAGEAAVVFEAARVFASGELDDPGLEPLLDLCRESAKWWVEFGSRLTQESKS